MLIRMPDYAEQFHCLAGNCPHSCCIGWEVVLDPDTVARYEAAEGELGEKLRASMQTDEEGDVCFPLRGGRCPFLDGENLCEIHRTLGQEATSITCREHPRFIEDYGPFREITFSASCPEANRLLLSSTAPLTFTEWEDDESLTEIPQQLSEAGAVGRGGARERAEFLPQAETEESGLCDDEGDEWLPLLLPLRQRMLELLADRGRPVKERLGEFLRLARAAQYLLDEEKEERLPELAERWKQGQADVTDWDLFPAALRLLAGLEVLEPDWRDVLAQAETAEPAAVPEELLERIAVYFAFRYLLKTVNDGDLLSRAQLCVFAVLAVERIAGVCGLSEALRRFSREVEHNEENVEVLLETFRWGDGAL